MSQTDDMDVLAKEKLRKLGEIKERGINPYPYNFDKKGVSSDIKRKYDETLKEEEHSGEKVSVAGRIMTLRRMGKVTFMHIQDEAGQIQLYFRQDDIDKEAYKFLKKLDLGDIVGAFGEIFKTKTGEISIAVESYSLLCKSINPLPEKYHGLKDKEARYRQRYVDLIVNPEVKTVFKKRSAIFKAIRDFLDERNFMEVETPLLQTQYGGASARPFVTHINAWNMPMYLSISPELYLKRLLVGGFEKIFTICKNFRNEGVDHSHNPEFTMIEIYQAYVDYTDMMKLIEDCYEYVSLKVNGTTKVKHLYDGKEVEIDFKAPWPRKTMSQAILDELSIDVKSMSQEELLDFANSKGLEVSGKDSWGDLVLEIFDLVEPTIIQPTHIYDMPKEGTPLCKRNREDDRFNEQCEPVGLGMELGNMYSELNDPILQEEEFKAQVERGRGGDDEAHPMDTDFLNAIKTGMPPTGGIGWGIDRMAILMTGVEGIRDIIFFPTMKPEVVEGEKKKKSKNSKIAVALINKSAITEKWQELNTVSHLTAALGARQGKSLFMQDSIITKDNHEIKLNIQHAIMIKEISSSKDCVELVRKAKEKGLEVSEFTKEMIETTDDVKVSFQTKEKNLLDITYLGVLVFGKKSVVDELTKELPLYK